MTLFAPFCFRCDILANRYKRVFRCGGVCQFDVDCGKYYRFCDILTTVKIEVQHLRRFPVHGA